MKRKWSEFNIYNLRYMGVALSFIGFIYYSYIFHYLQDQYNIPVHISLDFQIVVFHILFILMIWSFVQSVITDPGRVPVYWGLFLDDPESKKRRYCLICHVFKPERCHHCSTCLRCVLNMDHHCPWINNCVGFQNRKFFMLMLLYICLTCVFCLFTMAPILLDILMNKREQKNLSDMSIKIGSFISLIIFTPVITHFFHFHIKLVAFNHTTIEKLEKAREAQEKLVDPTLASIHKNLNLIDDVTNVYDLGKQINFHQVFGLNPILWFIPMFGESGKPYGDGVVWNKSSLQRIITLEVKEASDQNKQQQSQQQLFAKQNQSDNNNTNNNIQPNELFQPYILPLQNQDQIPNKTFDDSHFISSFQNSQLNQQYQQQNNNQSEYNNNFNNQKINNNNQNNSNNNIGNNSQRSSYVNDYQSSFMINLLNQNSSINNLNNNMNTINNNTKIITPSIYNNTNNVNNISIGQSPGQ